MEERHEREQYFFDEATLTRLTEFLGGWRAPCCLCAPLLGKSLVEAGVNARILDIDDRFGDLPGFQHFDIASPHWLGEEFDVIVCDPPFFHVSLKQMFATLRMLSRNLFTQPLLVSYLQRRASAVTRTFSPFGLQSTGYCPGYATVQDIAKNRIEFFSNLPSAELNRLCSNR